LRDSAGSVYLQNGGSLQSDAVTVSRSPVESVVTQVIFDALFMLSFILILNQVAQGQLCAFKLSDNVFLTPCCMTMLTVCLPVFEQR